MLGAYDFQRAEHQELAYQCSLCGLCSAICPQQLDPCAFFAEVRRTHVRDGHFDPIPYRRILRYEKIGTSSLFSGYGLPAGCQTVFFPGCAMPGTRPDVTLRIFTYLQAQIPALGLILDCCMKPSHDLGLRDHVQAHWAAVLATLKHHGVTAVVVACPNCHKMFRQYAPAMTVRTVYELIDLPANEPKKLSGQELTVHDPCPLRHQDEVHKAVRALLVRLGARLVEMKHAGRQTFCCGEGGAVGVKNPAFSSNWTALRVAEAEGRHMVSYCAGCCHHLGRHSPTSHIADLLFGQAEVGRFQAARGLLTYFNRLLVKRRLKKLLPVVARQRTAQPLPQE